MKPCVISVNGSDYYVSCDQLENLYYDGQYLVNIGSQNIVAYSSWVISGNNNSGYPRLSFNSLSVATIRQSANTTTTVLQVRDYFIKSNSLSNSSLTVFLFFGILILLFFKKGR